MNKVVLAWCNLQFASQSFLRPPALPLALTRRSSKQLRTNRRAKIRAKSIGSLLQLHPQHTRRYKARKEEKSLPPPIVPLFPNTPFSLDPTSGDHQVNGCFDAFPCRAFTRSHLYRPWFSEIVCRRLRPVMYRRRRPSNSRRSRRHFIKLFSTPKHHHPRRAEADWLASSKISHEVGVVPVPRRRLQHRGPIMPLSRRP